MALHPASFDDHIFRLLIEAVDDYAIYIIDAQGHILTGTMVPSAILATTPMKSLANLSSCFTPLRI